MADIIDTKNSGEKISQKEVDEAFKDIKKAWDHMLESSGKSLEVFIMTDKKAHSFLFKYHLTKEAVESEGLKMPQLVKGLSIELS